MGDVRATEVKSFAVVVFPSDQSVEVVPTKWMSTDEKTCPFPKNRPKGFLKAQEDPNSIPDPLWPIWQIEICKQYETFSKAHKKAERVIKNLDSSSGIEGHSVTPPRIEPEARDDSETSDPPLPYSTSRSTEVHSSPNNPEQSSLSDSLAGVTFVVHDERLTTLIEEFRAFQEVSLQNQLNLKEEIKNLKTIVLRIQAGHDVSNISNSGYSESLWPISSTTDINEVEDRLKNNEYFNSQSNLLSRIGGVTVSKTVNNTLKFVIAHSFALTLRLTSTSQKQQFGGTLCFKLVKESVKKFYQSASDEKTKLEITDDKIETLIGKWLRDSINRGGEGKLNRKKHGSRNINQNQESEGSTSDNVEANTTTPSSLQHPSSP